MSRKLLAVIALLLPSIAMADMELDTLKNKASYAIGVDVARSMKNRGLDLDTDALIQGMRDETAGDTRLDMSEMAKAKHEYQALARMEAAKRQAVEAEKNKMAGEVFLLENAAKEGVITTDSGLQYKILREGDGDSPTLQSKVSTHYKGTLIDGQEFDSSYSRGKPADFPVSGVIKGWTEALQLMKIGGKWELTIPSELAYGSAPRRGLIEPNSTLIFEIELLEIK